MLNLSEFSLNHHPFGVKMVAKISDVEFRCYILVVDLRTSYEISRERFHGRQMAAGSPWQFGQLAHRRRPGDHNGGLHESGNDRTGGWDVGGGQRDDPVEDTRRLAIDVSMD